MNCAWCEMELDTADRQSIRLSNTQPPWTVRSTYGAAGAIAAAGRAFAEVLRPEPIVTLWFHRECWQGFLQSLEIGKQAYRAFGGNEA